MHIIDLETKSLVKSPRAVQSGGRRDELTSKLPKDRRESLGSSRDGKFPLAGDDRVRTKLEAYEAQINGMRQVVDKVVCQHEILFTLKWLIQRAREQQTEESKVQTAEWRAEREAVDYKQRVLRFPNIFLFRLTLKFTQFLESPRWCEADPRSKVPQNLHTSEQLNIYPPTWIGL